MNIFAKLIFLALFLGIVTNKILAKSLEKADNGEDESSQQMQGDELEATTTTGIIMAFADSQLSGNDTEPPKCAERHQVCRTHKPLPLPCCGDFVCKVTYGEQHCVEQDFSAS